MPPSTTKLAGPKLLVADDEPIFLNACSATLRNAGYRVLEAADGEQALDLAGREAPALVILDVDMPLLNGWDVLRTLRSRGARMPVLMLTGLVDVPNRVKGLATGADDYIPKPCDARELLARVHAHLRRSTPVVAGERILQFGPVRVDLDQRTTASAGETPSLTRTEFGILEVLARNPGRPVTREALLDAVWGYTNRPNTRTVETHIWRLRGKLGDGGAEPRWIKTVPSAGYLLVGDAVA